MKNRKNLFQVTFVKPNNHVTNSPNYIFYKHARNNTFQGCELVFANCMSNPLWRIDTHLQVTLLNKVNKSVINLQRFK